MPNRCLECGNPQHKAHGLCKRCYMRAWRLERSTSARRRYRSCSDALEDFAFIAETAGTRDPASPFGWTRNTRRVAAERMGMRLESLERALLRARVTDVRQDAHTERSERGHT